MHTKFMLAGEQTGKDKLRPTLKELKQNRLN